MRFSNNLIAADYTREFEQMFGGRLSLGTAPSFDPDRPLDIRLIVRWETLVFAGHQG